MRRVLAPAAATLLLAGCASGGTATATRSSASSASASVPVSPGSTGGAPATETATLTCGDAIDGGPPPEDSEEVLGVVALPTSPAHTALQAAGSGDPAAPRLFAKTGLLIRAGSAFELTVSPPPGNAVGIAWGNPGPEPTRRFAVPACPDTFGTGWLAYPGGYWADRPLCLPVTVRVQDMVRQVAIGVGAACPGQQPPPQPG